MKQVRCLIVLIIVSVLACCFSSCNGDEQLAVMKVGEHTIGYDEYRYFYMNFRDEHESIGDSDYSDEIKQEIEDALKSKYAKTDYAASREVSLDDDDMSAVDENKQSFLDYYGSEEALNEALDSGYLTSDLFYSLLCDEALEEKLREYEYDEYTGSIVSDDATVSAYIYDKFCHATQILILNESGDDIVANYELACDIRQKALDGEDFEELILEYNEDTSMNGDTTGYYFAPGQYISEFENTAYSLETGEISEVVSSTLGWHIIKRLPLDDEYIDSHFEELREIYKVAVFNENVEALADAMSVTYTGYYATLTDDMLVNGIKQAK